MSVDSAYYIERYLNDGKNRYIFKYESIGAVAIDAYSVLTADTTQRTPLVIDVDYTLELERAEFPTYKGGVIILNTPLSADSFLQVERKTPIISDYLAETEEPFETLQFEFVMDRICFIQQEIEGSKCDCRKGCAPPTLSSEPQDQPVVSCSTPDCDASYNYAVRKATLTYWPLNDFDYYADSVGQPLRYAVAPFGSGPDMFLRQPETNTGDWSLGSNYWTRKGATSGMTICSPPPDGGGERGFILACDYDASPTQVPGALTGFMFWPDSQMSGSYNEGVSWHITGATGSSGNTLPEYMALTTYQVDYKHANGSQAANPRELFFILLINPNSTVTLQGPGVLETFNVNSIGLNSAQGASWTVNWQLGTIANNAVLDVQVYYNGVLAVDAQCIDTSPVAEVGDFDFVPRPLVSDVNGTTLFQNLNINLTAFFHSGGEPMDPFEMYDVFQQQYDNYVDPNTSCIYFEE